MTLLAMVHAHLTCLMLLIYNTTRKRIHRQE